MPGCAFNVQTRLATNKHKNPGFEMISGTILHYEILEKLGEGGMGEVYKARDTKLDRFVALKFLPSNLVATEADKARFIMEAKAASALNHPNICTIFDIHEADGNLFIVMEYVDGETLRSKKQSFSTKQVIDIGSQAADGLAEAHEKGIVHRDIKPENLMITKNGNVKIMDFGLAKLNSPTEASRLTKAGTTLGTVGYMSPEQVQGQDVDHRSDIFSLGVVLYELLSGESPFKGVHETAIMYEIVNVDPEPVSARKEGIDPELDRIIFECLEKDKEERYQSARELSKDLKRFKRDSGRQRVSRMSSVREPFRNETRQYSSGSHPIADFDADSGGGIAARNSFHRLLVNPKMFWAVSVVLLISTLLLAYFSIFSDRDVAGQEIKATILPPPSATLDNQEGSNIAISPDGKFIAFVAVDSSGNIKLWVRPVNSLAARPVADVTNSVYPFWSPDSKYIAYFANQRLMKLSLDDGISVALCNAESGRGGSWSKNGVIVFSPTPESGLFEIPETGGEPRELLKPTDNTLSLRWPFFLPDGKHFLYSTQHSQSGSSAADGIYVSSLDGGKPKELVNVSSNSQYADGYLFYVSQSILLARQFDPGSLEFSGDARSIAQNVQYYDVRISGTYSVSTRGTLIYEETTSQNDRAVLFNLAGNAVKPLFDRHVWDSASFSPDGTRIAFDCYDISQKNIDIWTYDMARNVLTRLTFSQAADVLPVWTPNGKQIAFSSNRSGGAFDSYIKNSNGSGTSTLLYKSDKTKFVTAFSSDGKYALANINDLAQKNSGSDIALLSLGGSVTPQNFLSTNFNEGNAVFSPDMKWVAYVSDESGKAQVYVVPFKNGSGKWQISVNGGGSPHWMDGGKKLYFFTQDNKIMGVDINESGASISPGRPYPVFSTTMQVTTLLDIDRSGKNVLAEVPNGKSVPSPLTLVANWRQEFENR